MHGPLYRPASPCISIKHVFGMRYTLVLTPNKCVCLLIPLARSDFAVFL